MVSYSPSSPLYTPASYSPRSPSVPSNEKLSYGSPEYEVDNDSDGVYVDEEDMGAEQEHEQFEGSVGDAASEQRIIQEAEYAAVEAKVKALELQLEASNKACSAAKAELEALKHEKIKLRETVKAQRKQLRANDEELVSTRDKAIQEWRQSEEFRQAARSYAREDMDSRKRRRRSRD
nr:uncharacterized protein LOC109165411 [Ipomoea batatas]